LVGIKFRFECGVHRAHQGVIGGVVVRVRLGSCARQWAQGAREADTQQARVA